MSIPKESYDLKPDAPEVYVKKPKAFKDFEVSSSSSKFYKETSFKSKGDHCFLLPMKSFVDVFSNPSFVDTCVELALDCCAQYCKVNSKEDSRKPVVVKSVICEADDKKGNPLAKCYAIFSLYNYSLQDHARGATPTLSDVRFQVKVNSPLFNTKKVEDENGDVAWVYDAMGLNMHFDTFLEVIRKSQFQQAVMEAKQMLQETGFYPEGNDVVDTDVQRPSSPTTVLEFCSGEKKLKIQDPQIDSTSPTDDEKEVKVASRNTRKSAKN